MQRAHRAELLHSRPHTVHVLTRFTGHARRTPPQPDRPALRRGRGRPPDAALHRRPPAPRARAEPDARRPLRRAIRGSSTSTSPASARRSTSRSHEDGTPFETARVGAPARHPVRRDRHLRRARAGAGQLGARGRARERPQPDLDHRPLPPRDRRQRLASPATPAGMRGQAALLEHVELGRRAAIGAARRRVLTWRGVERAAAVRATCPLCERSLRPQPKTAKAQDPHSDPPFRPRARLGVALDRHTSAYRPPREGNLKTYAGPRASWQPRPGASRRGARHPTYPSRLGVFARLAYNYRWAWDPDGPDVFRGRRPRPLGDASPRTR